MKKLCIFFLISALYSMHVSSMDGPNQLPILPPDIINLILNKYLITRFKGNEKTSLAEDITRTIDRCRNVSRYWREMCDSPVTFRRIVQLNIRDRFPRLDCNEVTDEIRCVTLPAAESYFQLSHALNMNINNLGLIQIKNYIENGADINYASAFYIHRILPIGLMDWVEADIPHIYPLLFIADTERTKILLDLGADINITFRGTSPLAWMIPSMNNVPKAQQIAHIKLLLTYNPINKCLLEAIDTNDDEIMKAILQHKNIPRQQIADAIRYARKKHFHTGLNLLKDFQDEIRRKSQFLYNFVCNLTIAQINTLLQEGAQATYLEKGKRPILMLTRHSYEKTDLLLAHGADVNATFNKKTPMRLAMEKQDIALTRLFLSYNPKNKHLDVLVRTNNPEMARLFIRHEHGLTQNDLYTCICDSIFARKTKILPFFIRAYPNYELIAMVLELFKQKNVNRQHARNLLIITELLSTLPTKEVDKFRENGM